jgi:MFS family permease
MARQSSLLTPVLIGGSIILLLSMAIRSSFGLFQIPIAEEFGWLRAEFSLAIAIQNLAWGIGQPIFGAIAERFGDRRAIVLGAVLYAAGLVLSAFAITPGQHQVLEILVGFGIAGTGFGVILAIVGRAASNEQRSLALGIATAAGSGGQVVGPVLAEGLLAVMPWQSVFLVFAGIITRQPPAPAASAQPRPASRAELQESLSETLGKAFPRSVLHADLRGLLLLRLPAGLHHRAFPGLHHRGLRPDRPRLGASRAGAHHDLGTGRRRHLADRLTNIAGTILAGWLGSRFPRKYLLAAIYTGRTLAAAAFIVLPMTPLTVIVFSLVMGSLWLATVPLTAGLVGYIYGLRYMGTLYGIVFFSHQLGSFMGIWLGGWMYDLYGTYDAVWWVGVAVGALSAMVHLPIRERPLEERAPLAA